MFRIITLIQILLYMQYLIINTRFDVFDFAFS